MHFRDSPDSLNGLGISGNIWFCRFAVTYIYAYIYLICWSVIGTLKQIFSWSQLSQTCDWYPRELQKVPICQNIFRKISSFTWILRTAMNVSFSVLNMFQCWYYIFLYLYIYFFFLVYSVKCRLCIYMILYTQ